MIEPRKSVKITKQRSRSRGKFEYGGRLRGAGSVGRSYDLAVISSSEFEPFMSSSELFLGNLSYGNNYSDPNSEGENGSDI